MSKEIGPVLVTGSSSGIGKFLCEFLARKGVIVFASARNISTLSLINSLDSSISKNLISLELDVTNSDSIENAVEFVTKKNFGLYAIVNNAGVGDLGFHSTFTDQEMYDIFNVNVFGPWRMSKMFLPLLLESKGRIINIGSQGGIITKKLYGPYSMTKYALEAFSESLREELIPFNVQVCIIQPGGIISEIGEKSLPRFLKRLQQAPFPFIDESKVILQLLEQSASNQKSEKSEMPESEINRKPSSPEIVAIAVNEALLSNNPKTRYLVGTKWEGNRVINALVSKLLDENDNPVHNYSRHELISILDSHIESRKKNKAN
jgi:short-subunit dehydrogenase